METIIDTVYAYQLEYGDVTPRGTVTGIDDSSNSLIFIGFDNEDEEGFNPFDLFSLLGIVYTEEV